MEVPRHVQNRDETPPASLQSSQDSDEIKTSPETKRKILRLPIIPSFNFSLKIFRGVAKTYNPIADTSPDNNDFICTSSPTAVHCHFSADTGPAEFRSAMTTALLSNGEEAFRKSIELLKKLIPKLTTREQDGADIFVIIALDELSLQPSELHSTKFKWLIRLLMDHYPKQFYDLCQSQASDKNGYDARIKNLSVASATFFELLEATKNKELRKQARSLFLNVAVNEAVRRASNKADGKKFRSVMCKSLAESLRMIKDPAASPDELRRIARTLIQCATENRIEGGDILKYFVAEKSVSCINLIGAVIEEACTGINHPNNQFSTDILDSVLKTALVGGKGIRAIGRAAPGLVRWLVANNCAMAKRLEGSKALLFMAAILGAAIQTVGSDQEKLWDIDTLQRHIKEALNEINPEFSAEIIKAMI